MSVTEKNQKALRIKLDEIKDSGYHLSCSKSKEWISEIFNDIEDREFTFTDDIKIQMDFFRSGKSIVISGLIATGIKMSCIRCLSDFDYHLEAEFHYTLCPSDEKELAPEMEINRNDLDMLCYQGDSIDIPPLIREQILLTIPSSPLCRESCEGICSRCGSNLNQDLCQCDREEGTGSKFEALRHFPLKQ